MQTDRKCCRHGEFCFCNLSENALTRVPLGHMRERERALIRKMIDLRVTRQERGPVPLHELKQGMLMKKTPH
ncbi:hypothetical protein CIG75_18020 [Tumebacillus algifaecis]|uniref:Uncharacterized protein n=1 Tax=Tumebacillus algifaecis TaxID=1214604 RepID=A0A223D4X9_9BACL|nr:hypothetical protein [Tumebacillus algifaecis]ASS76679.1 hypothetical protein CIG75_18020 [Tumebacillus algifaecis]